MPPQWDSNPHTSKRVAAYGDSKSHISTIETPFFLKLSSILKQTLKNSAIPVLGRKSLKNMGFRGPQIITLLVASIY